MLSGPIRFFTALLCLIQFAFPVLSAHAESGFFRNSNSSSRWYRVDNRSTQGMAQARNSLRKERQKWEARKPKAKLAPVAAIAETTPVVEPARVEPVQVASTPVEPAPRKRHKNRLIAIGAAFLVSTAALTNYLLDFRALPPAAEVPQVEFRVTLQPRTLEPIAVEPAAPAAVEPVAPVVQEAEAVTPLPQFNGPVLSDPKEIDGAVTKDSESPTDLIVAPTADPGVKKVLKVVKHHYGD